MAAFRTKTNISEHGDDYGLYTRSYFPVGTDSWDLLQWHAPFHICDKTSQGEIQLIQTALGKDAPYRSIKSLNLATWEQIIEALTPVLDGEQSISWYKLHNHTPDVEPHKASSHISLDKAGLLRIGGRYTHRPGRGRRWLELKAPMVVWVEFFSDLKKTVDGYLHGQGSLQLTDSLHDDIISRRPQTSERLSSLLLAPR
jgi:hypothetical protein